MQFIFLLIILFLIGCVLYGIAAGVRVIARGVSSLTSNMSDDGAQATQPVLAAQATAAGASPLQRSVGELRELFALHQQGALTKEEFEGMKQRLLSAIKTDESRGN